MIVFVLDVGMLFVFDFGYVFICVIFDVGIVVEVLLGLSVVLMVFFVFGFEL